MTRPARLILWTILIALLAGAAWFLRGYPDLADLPIFRGERPGDAVEAAPPEPEEIVVEGRETPFLVRFDPVETGNHRC